MKRMFWCAVLAVFGLHGCVSNEIGSSKDVAQERIYLQYDFDFSEARRSGEFTAQFRFGGSKGTTLVLSSPSQMQWNSEVLPVDSLPSSGAFYRKSLGTESWWGQHTLTFTDTQGKTFTNHVVLNRPIIQPGGIKASVNQTLELSFILMGAQPDDEVDVYSVDTDSSFRYTFQLDKSGKTVLSIPAKELKRQTKSTVSLGFQLTQYRSLAQAPTEGGSTRLAYTLAPITLPITKD